MSTNANTDESASASLARAQYARRDWWGESDESDDESDEDADVIGHDPNGNTVTRMKVEGLAHLWLKQTTEEPLLDPISLCESPDNGMHDREGVRSDLTDPEVYPPTAETFATPRGRMERKAPSSRRWRYSEEFGHLTYGGIIPDRETEALLELVEYVSANISAVDVPPRNRRMISEGARTLKRRGDLHDVQIMRRVAEWIFMPKVLREDAERNYRR